MQNKESAVVFTDVHNHNYPQFNKDGNRLRNCLKVLDLCFSFAAKNGAKYIIFCGDLYDTQGEITTEVINETVARFKKLFARYPGIIFLAISGNHDHASKNLLKRPAITALTHLDSIYDNFVLLDNSSHILSKNVHLYGIPYYELKEDFNAKLNDVREKTIPGARNILLIHQTPAGIGNENIVADTDPAGEVYGVFDAVYCGHIHKHEVLNSKFTVVGSPLHRDLGDEGQEKGVLFIEDLSKPAEFEFITTRGLFPEYKSRKASELTEEDADDYVTVAPEIADEIVRDKAKVEEFNTSLKPAALLENYWNEAGAGDKELLKTGLSLL